jgi:nicotinamidase/pyrazinamidase
MPISLADAALAVVDVQNDFCEGGARPVAQGQAVVPVLNAYAERFAAAGRPVLATRDWHPARTRHFAGYGGVWPPHCVQGTAGAEFHPDLRLPEGTLVVSKGTEADEDAYSAFQGRLPDGTRLADALRKLGVRRLYVGGLATDYCVRSTVLDALREGFAVTTLLDASRGVNLKPHDAEEAIEEMVAAGAEVATLARLGPPAAR